MKELLRWKTSITYYEVASLIPSIQNARAVLYCRMWPVWTYDTSPHYIINKKTSQKNKNYRT